MAAMPKGEFFLGMLRRMVMDRAMQERRNMVVVGISPLQKNAPTIPSVRGMARRMGVWFCLCIRVF